VLSIQCTQVRPRPPDRTPDCELRDQPSHALQLECDVITHRPALEVMTQRGPRWDDKSQSPAHGWQLSSLILSVWPTHPKCKHRDGPAVAQKWNHQSRRSGHTGNTEVSKSPFERFPQTFSARSHLRWVGQLCRAQRQAWPEVPLRVNIQFTLPGTEMQASASREAWRNAWCSRIRWSAV